MNAIFSIAIDGPSGAGKSTVARAIAQRSGAIYLDTGAMYRAFGLHMLQRNIDPANAQAVLAEADSVRIDVRHVDGVQRIFLAGEDVSEAIRAPEVSLAASAVSKIPEVREKLVGLQRALAEGRSVVMDGRDIGTKVLPNATLKIYLSADPAQRARRRHQELAEKGRADSYEQVYQEMMARDHADSTRAASPLCRAEDAVPVDSSELSVEQVTLQVLALLEEVLGV